MSAARKANWLGLFASLVWFWGVVLFFFPEPVNLLTDVMPAILRPRNFFQFLLMVVPLACIFTFLTALISKHRELIPAWLVLPIVAFFVMGLVASLGGLFIFILWKGAIGFLFFGLSPLCILAAFWVMLLKESPLQVFGCEIRERNK